MPLPPGVQNVTVIGTYIDSDGKPARGFLKFKAAVAQAGSGVVIPANEVQAKLNNQGKFSIVLPTTDNSGLGPDGWTYAVKVILEGAATLQKFNIFLQVGGGSEQDIANLIPVAPVTPSTPMATKAEVDAVAARLGFEYVQMFASSIWAIVHDLGYKPNVQVFDSAGDECLGEIEHDDEDGLTIVFSAAISGRAILS